MRLQKTGHAKNRYEASEGKKEGIFPPKWGLVVEKNKTLNISNKNQ